MIGRHRQMRAELRCDWLRRDTGARSSVSTSVQLTSIQPSPLRPSELGPPSRWPVAPFSSVNSSTQVTPSQGQGGRRLGDWAQTAQLSTLVPPWAGAGLCVVLVPAAAAWPSHYHIGYNGATATILRTITITSPATPAVM